jgi:hypothetical protein
MSKRCNLTKTIRVLVLVGFALGQLGCHEAPVSDSTPGVFFPLAPGTTWK